MSTKMTKIGLIGGLASAMILTTGAIVAECRRHRAMNQLIETEMALNIVQFDNHMKERRISVLEGELEKAKSENKKEES